jgi:CO/xanthine dehydrogenase FAD-binding subunit
LTAQETIEKPGIEGYTAPTTVEDAVRVLADGDVTVLAGGTDLTVQVDAGRIRYGKTLMNIRRIAALDGVERTDGEIAIGALTTVTDLLDDAELAKTVPILRATADRFASMQIRNAATIGGNLCNASPAGDMIVPLLLLDAEVELASWRNEDVVTRMVPLKDFFTGPGKTVRGDNELLTRVVFKTPADGFAARFEKSGPRPALEISTVSAGVAGTLKDGVMSNARVVLGAVAPTPLRAAKAEAALEGKTLNAGTIAAAAQAACDDCTPIDDVRASSWYRHHLVRIYMERLLTDVAEN